MNLKTIVLFRPCYGLARLSEFEAVATCRHPNVQINWKWDKECHLYYGGDYGPSIVQELPDELTPQQWADVGIRCISCKAVFQVLSEGPTLSDCVEMAIRIPREEFLSKVKSTWAMQIKHMGKMKRLHPIERTQRIEMFKGILDVLNCRTVRIDNPETEMWLLEDCRSLEKLDPGIDRHETHYCWFLLKINPAPTSSASDLAKLTDVKKRVFIHTTTLAADRAILMSNLAQARPNTVVLDPFCGSGGLLLSSTLLGAKAIGSDIDADLIQHENQPLNFPSSPSRPLRGIEVVSYGDSFLELNLPSPTVCTLDIFDLDIVEQVLLINGGKYNAIVTDPPYGIRETLSNRTDAELIKKMCDVAGDVLVENGRLVFLMLVECSSSIAKECHYTLSNQIISMIESYPLTLKLLSIERFNSRLWRATIVLVKN